MAVMLRKSLVLEIRRAQTNKTFIASRHNFNVHLGVLWSNFIKILFFLSPFNFIKQKVWFKMFSQFIRNQTYRFSIFLHVSLAIHRNLRNWHQLFYNRSGSNKIQALPIFIFLVYCFHGNIDYL